jgi:hypothetical protein
LNKKLPKKEGERINISDSIDLDSLRIQLIGESQLSLEDRIGELEPMDAEGSKTQTEEEKELLSEIIKVVNEVHGVALQDEDKLDLKNVNKRLIENKDLDEKMSGNNSFDDKKEYFNSLFKGEVSEYYGDRLDFYKKVMNPKVLPMLMDVMFTDYLKQKGM